MTIIAFYARIDCIKKSSIKPTEIQGRNRLCQDNYKQEKKRGSFAM